MLFAAVLDITGCTSPTWTGALCCFTIYNSWSVLVGELSLNFLSFRSHQGQRWTHFCCPSQPAVKEERFQSHRQGGRDTTSLSAGREGCMERLAHKWCDTVHWAIWRTFHNFPRKNLITFNHESFMAVHMFSQGALFQFPWVISLYSHQ